MSSPEHRATRSPATATTLPGEHDHLRALNAFGAAVAQMGAALGLAEARLARAEGMDRLETTLSVPLEQALDWDARPLAEAFRVLGDDLRIDLALSGLDSRESLPAASLRAGRAPTDALADFLATAREMASIQGEDVAVELRLAIGKAGALAALKSLLASRPEHLGSEEALAQTKLLVWYHHAGFERIARLSALADWEPLGLVRETGRTVIALCDATGYLAGPALEVIGARAETPPRWLLLSRAAWRQFEEQCRRVRQLRDEESLWVGGARIITPAHLRLSPRNPGLEELAVALVELQAGVAAAYLASSLHETADELLLRFAGARPATCHLVASDLTPRSPLPRGEGEADLARFATWVFNHGSPDKLVIARECLARELPPGATVTLAQVATAAGPAFEAARANLALYLRGSSLAYFQARQQAEDAVGAYTLGVRKGVSDLTTDVVNNVYATVGLLVGVVIAGLIQPRDSLPVQRLGAGLYTAYVAFVLGFLLRARWQRYRLERTEVAGRLAAMEELSEPERSRLRAQAGAADTHFEAYFALSRRIYIALACLGALYFLLLLTPLGPHVALPHGR